MGDSENIMVSPSKSSTSSLTDENSSNLDLDSNHYSSPLDDSCLTTAKDIEEAIEEVRALVLETNVPTLDHNRHDLVKRLIDLRLKLQNVKELAEESSEISSTSEKVKLVQHHHFIPQTRIVHYSPQYCDRCSTAIWTLVQNYYQCKKCSYQCHSKCLNAVVRTCVSLNASIETQYILSICPEVGLAAQNYSCVECKAHFALKNGWMEPRRCDYNGLYYCPLCHKNNTSVIPARILKNWDFDVRKVCEATRQFFTLMSKKPNIHLEKINSKLFSLVEELNDVRRLREEIIVMKEYMMTCRSAINQKLLRLLEERQHFVENSYMYSLQDIIDIPNGATHKFLHGIHSTYLKHIKNDCQTCQGKGFICEICQNDQIIFSFDSGVHQCQKCYGVFHNFCFAKRASCPKCLRKQKQKLHTLE